MIELALPSSLPATGADVRVRFRRVPERSYVVRASVCSSNQPAIDVGESYIYGRGQGSAASEQAAVHVRLDARTVPPGPDPGRVLRLDIEELNGTPVTDPHALELLDWEIVASAG